MHATSLGSKVKTITHTHTHTHTEYCKTHSDIGRPQKSADATSRDFICIYSYMILLHVNMEKDKSYKFQ